MRRHSRHRACFLAALRDLDEVGAVALLDPAGDAPEGTAAEARSTLGEKPLRVYATLKDLLAAETPAMAIVTLTGAEGAHSRARGEAGAQASLMSGYVLDANKQIDLTLWGSRGWLRFDMASSTADWHSPQESMNGVSNRQFRYDAPGGGGYTPFTRDCLRASLGQISSPITAAEGLEVLRVIFAAYESAKSGQTVRL